MKKILYIIAVLALIFHTGCNPLNEIQSELDSAKTPYSEKISYTLTDDDYDQIYTLFKEDAELSSAAKMVSSLKSFGDDRPSTDFIPALLGYKFIALDSGSTASVTFNYSYYHEFTDDEIDTMGYYDNESDVPDFKAYILFSTQFSNPKENQKALLTYFIKTSTDTTQYLVYYKYIDDKTGWQDQEVHYFNAADYTEMGIADGQFSDDYPADTYINLYLKNHNPYAVEGDYQNVAYIMNGNYYTDRYFFDGTNWVKYQERTEQYIYGSTGWVFDPTVDMTMSCNDYQIIVDWVAENKPEYMHPTYSNTEYYFGASSYYCNFDMRIATRTTNDPDGLLEGLSEDVVFDTLMGRLKEGIKIMLEAKYPDAQPFVNGVPVYYNVHFQTYEPPRKNYVIKFLCTAPGQFEYIEGPTEE